MESYKELIVWQKSMDLVVEVYHLVKKLPKEEIYVLSDQMRRSVVSIPSNIAEGHGRNGPKDYIHFLSIARGSKQELETQIFLCIRLGYISESEALQALSLCDTVGKMLYSIISKLSVRT